MHIAEPVVTLIGIFMLLLAIVNGSLFWTGVSFFLLVLALKE